MTTNLKILRDACIEEISTFDDFWLLAGLTNGSYEEGIRNKAFKKSVDSYEKFGVPPSTLARLRLGTNGNLKAILEQRNADLAPVTRTVGKGQDLSFDAWSGGTACKIEVKLVYDCTFTKYYPSVAADWKKLSQVRIAGFIGDLFLVVFFMQMPNYLRPSGSWQGNSKVYDCRSDYVVRASISTQVKELSKYLVVPMAWPSIEPLVHRLGALDAQTLLAVRNRFDAQFKPQVPWCIDPTRDFADAGVGVAIWQMP